MVTLSIFLGGGAIAADELQYCDSLGAPWVFIPCKCVRLQNPGSLWAALCFCRLHNYRTLSSSSHGACKFHASSRQHSLQHLCLCKHKTTIAALKWYLRPPPPPPPPHTHTCGALYADIATTGPRTSWPTTAPLAPCTSGQSSVWLRANLRWHCRATSRSPPEQTLAKAACSLPCSVCCLGSLGC